MQARHPATSLLKRSCATCRQRKTRCDGEKPCGTCRRLHCASKCVYPEPTVRHLSEHQDLSYTRGLLNKAQAILSTMFPDRTVSELYGLSQEALISLLRENAAVASSREIASKSDPPTGMDSFMAQRLPSPRWSESAECFADSADDVNLLQKADAGPAGDWQNLGRTTVASVLGAIVRMCGLAPEGSRGSDVASDSRPGPRQRRPDRPPPISISTARAQKLIDGYFEYCHMQLPVLDEAMFRANVNRYRNVPIQDVEAMNPGWVALYNMVLAMGSVAIGVAGSDEDILFFRSAHWHLSDAGLAVANMSALQAYIIMSGQYLHYRCRPHLGYSINGMAARIASSLSGNLAGHTYREQRGLWLRIWWGIYFNDMSSCTNLKNELLLSNSFAAINEIAPLDDIDETEMGSDLPWLRHSVKLARLMEHAMQLLYEGQGSMDPVDGYAIDNAIQDWYLDLSFHIRACDHSNSRVQILRVMVLMRCQWLRLVYLRTYIVVAVRNGISYEEMPADARRLVDTMRVVANESLSTIEMSFMPNTFFGWNAVWYLYNLALVSLLNLLWDPTSELVHDWHRQVQTSLDLFNRLRGYSLVGGESHAAISKLYWNVRTRLAAIERSSPTSASDAFGHDYSWLLQLPMDPAAIGYEDVYAEPDDFGSLASAAYFPTDAESLTDSALAAFSPSGRSCDDQVFMNVPV